MLTASTLFGGEAWKGEGGSQGWVPCACDGPEMGPSSLSAAFHHGPISLFYLWLRSRSSPFSPFLCCSRSAVIACVSHLRPSSEGVGERKEPDDADGTLERVRSLLNSLAAVSQSTALPLQLVAVAVDMTEEVLARVLCPHNEEIGVAAGQVWLRNKDDEDSENAPPTAATG